MNKNTNPWMLATIFLLGLIIGFSVGRFTVGVGTTNQVAYNPPRE